MAWQVRVYLNLTFYPLGRLGQGPGAPLPLPGHPCKHRPPQLEEVVASTQEAEPVVNPKSWTDFRPSLEGVPAVSLSLCHLSSNSSGVR